MTKLRKQRRKKVYKHKVNRKRLRNKIFGLGKVQCKELKEAWNEHNSVKTNMRRMGLAYDPNKTIDIPNYKRDLRKSVLSSSSGEWNEESIVEEVKPGKAFVAEQLEIEAKAPRVKLFRLSKKEVEWLSYLLDTYGTDYKAMARDKRNVYQDTWKQIRTRIRKFQCIPEQYSKYLEKRKLTSLEEERTSDDNDS